jgi:threonine synthase
LVARDDDYVKSRVGDGKKARDYFDNIRYGAKRLEQPNDSGVWLWHDFILPGFLQEDIVSLREGQTDLFEVPPWLGKEIGLQNLFIKLEGKSPSESFKDRGMPVAISDALRLKRSNPELGIVGVACASTGDTSAAAAIYAAYVRDELDCLVLVPAAKISDSQLFQAMAHGAKVRAIESPDGFDGCMRIIQEFTAAHPEYILVNSKNDMRVVGQESIALEILQDLRWQAPNWISIPVGNAGNLTALLNSLLRAKEFGLIDRLPGILAAQTAAADTLVRWSESGFSSYEPGEFQNTVASAMNINDPVSFPRIKHLMKQFDVHFYRSSEAEILRTWSQFTRAGANGCPQGAVALHAVQQARDAKLIKPKDTVVSISTASALKFTEAGIAHHTKGKMADFANPYIKVKGSLAKLEASL